MPIASINPATGATVRIFDPLAEADIDAKLGTAARAQSGWASAALATRSAALTNAADVMDAEVRQLAEVATLEMGKPIGAARTEVHKCATALRHYAQHAEQFLKPRRVQSDSGESAGILYQPLGVILAVMPWNFPYWQVVRFAAPALAAGNAAVLKHASNVPQCALAIEDVFRRAGIPDGVFQTFLLPASGVERLIADVRIAAVTLTGSEAAGSQVAAAAGRHLKKSVLELGGSDPFVVLASADVERAAQVACSARVINSGQSCIAAKRFIVVEQVADAFEDAFVRQMAALKVGDPLLETTQVGPLATQQVLGDVERQVDGAVRQGARVLTGGKRLDSPGFFYPPTVLINVAPNSAVCTEEVFGPVAPIIRVADADEALARANDSQYGLGASVWTSNAREADMFATGLQCGSVFINASVQSDPRFPFGGIKRSGYGRELSDIGMYEFMNIKTVRAREVPAGEL